MIALYPVVTEIGANIIVLHVQQLVYQDGHAYTQMRSDIALHNLIRKV